jgi:predicted metalloprotease
LRSAWTNPGFPARSTPNWSQNFETLFSGYRYEPPSKIKPYRDGEPPDTACTAGKDPRRYVNNALHCRADHSLAYSVDMLRKLYDELGDFAPVVIMFHEFGHHVDMLSGEKSLYTIQGEWEADCLAGIATRGAMQAGVLHEDDVREGSAALYGQVAAAASGGRGMTTARPSSAKLRS